jgi:hypothetical protein
MYTQMKMGAGKGKTRRLGANSAQVAQEGAIPYVEPHAEADITSEEFLNSPFYNGWNESDFFYLYDGCGALASAIHEQTHWPLYGLVTAAQEVKEKPFPIPYHLFVAHPSGRMLDAEGLYKPPRLPPDRVSLLLSPAHAKYLLEKGHLREPYGYPGAAELAKKILHNLKEFSFDALPQDADR